MEETIALVLTVLLFVCLYFGYRKLVTRTFEKIFSCKPRNEEE
jgi:hypothetical protein